jgi:hypothetical protein
MGRPDTGIPFMILLIFACNVSFLGHFLMVTTFRPIPSNLKDKNKHERVDSSPAKGWVLGIVPLTTMFKDPQEQWENQVPQRC